MNDGNGFFLDEIKLSLTGKVGDPGENVENMVTADFNNDGWPDLLLSVTHVNLQLLLNNKNGTFRDARFNLDYEPSPEAAFEPAAPDIGIADFNGDGLLDIYVSGLIGFPEVVLMNIGDGRFKNISDVLSFVHGGHKAVAADIDNDGRSELILWLEDGFFTFTFLPSDLLDSPPTQGGIEDGPSESRTPEIVSRFNHIVVIPGSAVNLFVTVAGSEPLTFEWFSGATGDTSAPITMEAKGSLIVSNLQQSILAWVRVSNAAGSVNSDTLIVTVKESRPPDQIVKEKVIVGWGNNDFGQAVFPEIPGESQEGEINAISAGANHNLALADSVVIAWGDNDAGQTEVPPDLTEAIAIGAGYRHSLAVRPDRTVVAWGDNSSGQLTVPEDLVDAVAVSGGAGHSVALRSDGTVVAWGDNSEGQLDVPADLEDVVGIDAGGYHTLAVTFDGRVIAWGRNDFGQIDVPNSVEGIVQVSAGENHSLALSVDLELSAWGDNRFGQLEPGFAQTAAIRSDRDDVQPRFNADEVAVVAAGLNHSLAIDTKGTLLAWGDDRDSQLDVPRNLEKVIMFAAGEGHTIVFTEREVLPEAEVERNRAAKALGGFELGDDWFFSRSFGIFNVSLAPWSFHESHGFQFVVGGANPGEIFLYDLGTESWWWTNSSSYPNFYSFTRNTWNFYFADTRNPRQFVDLQTQVFWSAN